MTVVPLLIVILINFVVTCQGVHSDLCSRQWPQLELLMPLNIMIHPPRRLNRNHEAIQFFLRSFLYFWPSQSNTSVVFVVDEEKVTSKEYKEFISLVHAHLLPVPNKPTVRFVENKAPLFRNQSYDRQQYLKFWADNFTNSEYVGFVDSDTVFSVAVDREDIFENPDDGYSTVFTSDIGTLIPVINGRTGPNGYSSIEKWSPEHDWPWSTFQLLGLHEPVRCMSYFPIVFKTMHLRTLREHISRRFNKPFSTAFQEFVSNNPHYSEFNIMCTFVFHNYRDSYKWYVHNTNPAWDGLTNPVPVKGLEFASFLPQFTASMLLPKPRIAVHARYHAFGSRHTIYSDKLMYGLFLQRGICESPPFPKRNDQQESFCNKWPKNISVFTIYPELHKFEGQEWLPPVQSEYAIETAQRERFRRIEKCDHWWNYDDYLIKDMCL